MKCTQEVNERNAERAKKEHPGKKYGAVAVTVTSQDLAAKTLTVETRGTDEQNHQFVIPMSEVWMECPSTIGKSEEDRRGSLYISKEGMKTAATGAPNVRIKGTLPENSPAIVNKWPDSGAADGHAPLEIWATDIVVTGYAFGNPDYQGQVSLMDLSLADLQQNLQIDNGGMITLSLTAAGFASFGVPMESDIEELRRAVELVSNVQSLQPPSALELARAVVLVDRWAALVAKKGLPKHLHEVVAGLVAKANQPAHAALPLAATIHGHGHGHSPVAHESNGHTK